ncbi:MAG: cation:proton antiporter [Euryarchaeota archaeon]|nr:cation:proton antiporter [Euryarchaeota archaeon]
MEFILDLAIFFIAAIAVGRLAKRLGQPAALGEMMVGIIVGPYVLGLVKYTETVGAFAEVGSIILLFIVGLKTESEKLSGIWRPAIFAGIGGVILPFFLGLIAALSFGFSVAEGLFLGAVLTATSIGITVRALSDMGKLNTREGLTILGAAVVDDILGVIILAIVLGILTGGLTLASVAFITTKAIIAWFLILFVGTRLLVPIFDRARVHDEALVLLFLAVCFGFAFITAQLGLSSIIGAFAIGLALSKTFKIHEALKNLDLIYVIFVPIFFISIGLLVDFRIFLKAFSLGLIITILAIIGKLVGCGVATFLVGYNLKEALRVGIGMVPRGEVGLIVAGIGLTSGLIGSEIYSIGVIAIVLTTFLAIPLLKPVFKS